MAKYKSTQNPSLPQPRERVCECIEPWKLGRVIIFRFEESTDLIEKERGRKRFFFFFRNEKEEEERKNSKRKRRRRKKEDAEEERRRRRKKKVERRRIKRKGESVQRIGVW